MQKEEKKSISNLTLVDIFSFTAAVVYLQSVLTVAHHTSMWVHGVHDGSGQTVGPPAIPALVIGLLLVAYSLYKSKMKFSKLHLVVITIFAVSSIFWLSGLRTNFYF
jgi:hypothetical protein